MARGRRLKEAVERQAVLSLELQHRIKNTLAMVGAIANQTMQGDSVADAREAFAARLMTLSRAHDLLTQSNWASARSGTSSKARWRRIGPAGARSAPAVPICI